MATGILLGIVLIVMSLAITSDVAYEGDFEYDYTDGYYYLELDGGDLGSRLDIYIESRSSNDIEMGIYVYQDYEETGSYEGETTIDESFSITSTGTVTIEIWIWSLGFDISDLDITIETNSYVGLICFGIVLLPLSFILGAGLGIAFLVVHFKTRGDKKKVDSKYKQEIIDLEKKIKEMDKLGIDTSKERKLLEEYKKG
ncbi:MAG: hypothetical protein ACMUIE_02705 [Thermoplasmatota archaeon]